MLILEIVCENLASNISLVINRSSTKLSNSVTLSRRDVLSWHLGSGSISTADYISSCNCEKSAHSVDIEGAAPCI